MTSGTFRIVQLIRSVLRPLGVERATFIRPLYHRFKKSLKHSTAEVDGFFLHLDRNDSLDLSLSPDYEVFERNLVKRWVREGDTVLDIGAHIGLFTLIMAREVGPKGRVFSFEPCPESHHLLAENIRANGLANVTLVEAAVGEETGWTTLFLNPLNSGDHRTHPTSQSGESVRVETIRLDDFEPLKGIPIDFIKMDVQGSEGEALKGMSGLLETNPGVRIFFEFWPSGLREAGADPLEVLLWLMRRDFRLFHLHEEDESIRRIQDGDEEGWIERLLTEFGAHSQRHTNLLAVGTSGRDPF
ncbi:MAG: FkbM family methyltransferase [Candidatus Omnitrophica bacterium]|nr:FkbM family methyltransferase [Candidatus Omnitrophota bacterium]